jgi:toxin secretion/phage lysis holin
VSAQQKGRFEHLNKEKTIFATITMAISTWVGIIAMPVLVLVALNIFDYITGLAASKFRAEIVSSYKSFRGIAKKVCMWLLIAIGGIVDWLLWFGMNKVGINIPICFLVSCAVAVWLIANEIISILENMKDIGVNFPPFLIPIVSRIKTQTEKKLEEEAVGKECEDND